MKKCQSEIKDNFEAVVYNESLVPRLLKNLEQE
jgi:hypothetical protein